MTPSEIAGRLMMLASQMEHEKRDSAAQACSEAAALILIYLDNTTGNGGQAYDRSVNATVTPLFDSLRKNDTDNRLD